MNSPIPFHAYIERFTIFDGTVTLMGWIFAPGREIRLVELLIGDAPPVEVPRGLPSDDVVSTFGGEAVAARFAVRVTSAESYERTLEPTLRVTFVDGAQLTVDGIADRNRANEPVHSIFVNFLQTIAAEAPGRLLEIGSRARSGITRKALIPATWEYVGLDVVAGPNVDVIGDAHRLSSIFEHGSFDAAMALSVLEHVLMPWKVGIELNRILRVGGLAYFLTHQTYGLHDDPWDFWRYSSEAWPAIFNHRSGFEIVASAMGEPAFIVPLRSGPHYNPYVPGYLASAVLVRKVSETTLVWDVELDEIIATAYPQQ